jgi:predicted methyltransferase
LKGNKNSENIIRILEKYDSARPQPDRNWDQFTATVATTAKRVTLMDFFQDIQEKKVLCLGDDDLVSVAVANLKKSAQVSVLDIDKQLLDAIETISTKENIQVITQAYDARQSLPRNFMGKFDVVFTDPPYTQSGVKLFLSRAIQALDPKNNSGRIYLCYGNSDRAKERFLPIYKILIDSGLMIRWVFDKFNRYQGAESVGSASSLFICDVTPKTRSLVKGEYRESIYTNN